MSDFKAVIGDHNELLVISTCKHDGATYFYYDNTTKCINALSSSHPEIDTGTFMDTARTEKAALAKILTATNDACCSVFILKRNVSK